MDAVHASKIPFPHATTADELLSAIYLQMVCTNEFLRALCKDKNMISDELLSSINWLDSTASAIFGKARPNLPVLSKDARGLP